MMKDSNTFASIVKNVYVDCTEKKELAARRDLVNRAVSRTVDLAADHKQQLQSVKHKETEFEKTIRERHAALVAEADKARDAALKTMKSLTSNISHDLNTKLKQRERNLEELLNIQEKLETAVTIETGDGVITVAKEIKRDCSDDTVNRLASSSVTIVHYPTLAAAVSKRVMLNQAQEFIGTVTVASETMEKIVAAVDVEMNVALKFNCGESAGTRVFSLCHVDEDPATVRVSYEQYEQSQDVPVKAFREGGQFVMNGDKVGKVTSKRYAKGRGMVTVPLTGGLRTYTKSLTAVHCILKNDFSGKADIIKVTVTSTDPFKTEDKQAFSVNVGPHRAVDVDDSEQVFVVVEEPRAPDVRRKVLMYRRPNQDPVSTYRPPYPDFSPSDVCFYTVGGQRVLLVSDEASDHIHVVSVEDDHFTFLRYLTSDCPLLVQPTAMNIDVEGRLWVACKGGNIITIKPTE